MFPWDECVELSKSQGSDRDGVLLSADDRINLAKVYQWLLEIPYQSNIKN